MSKTDGTNKQFPHWKILIGYLSTNTCVMGSTN